MRCRLSILRWNKLKNIMNYEQTKDKALRLLEFRSHSEKELKEKLIRAGADEEDTERVLEFCREYKFVNDREYARRKAADLRNLKKYGKHRIIAELKAKGIDGEYIDYALEEIDFDDSDMLYDLVKKKLGGDFEKKSTDRAMRYFIYRGYGISEIKNCIERARDEQDL